MKQNFYDPNAVAIANGNIFGFPFNEEEATLVLFPVPWEVTTSYGSGASLGPEAILKASLQLDFMDSLLEKPWTYGTFFHPIQQDILAQNVRLKKMVKQYIAEIERGIQTDSHKAILKEVNHLSEKLNETIYQKAIEINKKKKTMALIGGDHSTPYGLIKQVIEKSPDVTLIQFDAHADLRRQYEGFEYSHASIMYNVLTHLPVRQLIQVGIRDYCEEEKERIKNDHRIKVFFDREIRQKIYEGQHFQYVVSEIIESIESVNVYISFDIDVLTPYLCPNTGTPVPGGLDFNEVCYIIDRLARAGKKLVSFDLNEVAPGKVGEWDANVGARILFKLVNYFHYSNSQ